MTYEEQLSAAKHRAERDQARQEAKGLRDELETAEAEYRRHRANLDARYEKKADESRRRGQAMHGMSRLIRERNEEIKALKERIADMEPRLMPEGMEWPRTDGGEQVKIGDELIDDEDIHGWRRVDSIIFTNDGDGYLVVLENCRGVTDSYSPGERVKRPAVLAADGEPLEVGQTVWHVDTGHEYVVVEPSYGDTVIVRLAKYDDAEGEQYTPDQLTHERPDSWERLEEDANAATCVYFGVSDKYCGGCGHYSWDCAYDKARDLVRRAKALAGVSE